MKYGSRSLIFNAKSASCKRHAISSDRTDRVTRKIYCDTRASEKMSRAHGGCLGTGSRRRARQAAISPGEAQTAFDPGMPEWGNPAGVMPSHPGPNQIGPAGTTGGTETSKYPEEEKSTENPRVAASESGRAQTGMSVQAWGRCHTGVVGASGRGPQPPHAVTKAQGSGTAWKGRPQRVRAPYANPWRPAGCHPSRAGHVKPGPKQGGPPSKAKHSPVTDSEPVP